jgi:hypothetical protein
MANSDLPFSFTQLGREPLATPAASAALAIEVPCYYHAHVEGVVADVQQLFRRTVGAVR